MVNSEFWHGKRVLVTGHTGFKGSWLSLWLHLLGAQVSGYSLPPPTSPSLFEVAGIKDCLTRHIEGDVRDFDHLKAAMEKEHPEIVLHLAAQSLVRRSYRLPLETYATNVMGTVNLLEIVREVRDIRVVINVTSDKCYENKGQVWGYRENDPLGGYDPYSSSKGCSELITGAYQRSFFHPNTYPQHGVGLASVRAGNVIGGGDWGEDRLVPDIMKAYLSGGVAEIRSPHAIRPWQHVLEPLRGYLMLAEKLATHGPEYAEPWNFGPLESSANSVGWLVEQIGKLCGPEINWKMDDRQQPHEAHFLKIDSSKAKNRLGWQPLLSLETGIEWTVSWYKSFKDHPASIRPVMESQIISYQNLE